MNDKITVSKPLIEPIHWQTAPCQAIDLGKVTLGFSLNGNAFEAEAQAAMRFLPDARLTLTVTPKSKSERPPMSVSDMFRTIAHQKGANGAMVPCPMTVSQVKAVLAHGHWPDNLWDNKLTLRDAGVTIEGYCVRSGGAEGTMEFVPASSVVTTCLPSNDITVARFHLFNFPDFHGPEDYIYRCTDQSRHMSLVCGRAVLKANGWVVTIAATDKTNGICKAIEEQGGYAVTHIGQIEREDGKTFSSAQLESFLECLTAFLSFVLGRWAALSFPVGFDKTERKVFEQWGLPNAVSGSWNGSYSWFSAGRGRLLSEVFPGFVALWNDASWKDALWNAVYWYLAANQSGLDVRTEGGLILAQTALESLAWTYCVQHRKMISPDAFEPRGLSAADRLRLLATALGVPIDVPQSLSALHAKRGKKWEDALDAVSGVRNSLVHPRSKSALPDGSVFQAWELSLWFLEMVLLRLCGHNGRYRNRLARDGWAGDVEPVPWAEAKEEGV